MASTSRNISMQSIREQKDLTIDNSYPDDLQECHKELAELRYQNKRLENQLKATKILYNDKVNALLEKTKKNICLEADVLRYKSKMDNFENCKRQLQTVTEENDKLLECQHHLIEQLKMQRRNNRKNSESPVKTLPSLHRGNLHHLNTDHSCDKHMLSKGIEEKYYVTCQANEQAENTKNILSSTGDDEMHISKARIKLSVPNNVTERQRKFKLCTNCEVAVKNLKLKIADLQDMIDEKDDANDILQAQIETLNYRCNMSEERNRDLERSRIEAETTYIKLMKDLRVHALDNQDRFFQREREYQQVVEERELEYKQIVAAREREYRRTAARRNQAKALLEQKLINSFDDICKGAMRKRESLGSALVKRSLTKVRNVSNYFSRLRNSSSDSEPEVVTNDFVHSVQTVDPTDSSTQVNSLNKSSMSSEC